ncbi:hypothetical protein CH274_09165 [Rhodococcus sp. 06-418-5]|nr:hypothetical protein CH274_09165 [Rhodococcus sp. 06-418-5]
MSGDANINSMVILCAATTQPLATSACTVSTATTARTPVAKTMCTRQGSSGTATTARVVMTAKSTVPPIAVIVVSFNNRPAAIDTSEYTMNAVSRRGPGHRPKNQRKATGNAVRLIATTAGTRQPLYSSDGALSKPMRPIDNVPEPTSNRMTRVRVASRSNSPATEPSARCCDDTRRPEAEMNGRTANIG